MTRRDLLFTTRAYLITRVVLIVVAWTALSRFPVVFAQGQWQAFPELLWLDGWVRWDAAWYRSIFEEGYAYTAGQRSNVAFFPLYPWLAGVLSWPLRAALGPEQSFYVAALVLSHVGSWLALLGLHGLTRERIGRAAADRAVWLLCLFPFSFYLGAVYSEGVFLALAIWAFRFADRGRWVAACLAASLAGVTRVPGFLVAIGLALEYVRRHGLHPRGWGREALAFLVTPVPLLLLLGFFALRFEDPLVFVAIQQESWGRSEGFDVAAHWTVLTAGGLSLPGSAVTAWRLALLPGLLIATGLVWRWLGTALGIYTLLALAIPLATGLEAFERYSLAVFPVFAALGASLRGRLAWGLIVALFVPSLVCFTVWFARWAQMVAVAR